MNLSQKIESYLFYTGESCTLKKLATVFDVGQSEVEEALQNLEQSLTNRGIVLMKNGDEVMLATHPDMNELIQSIKKQELSDPLSKAALETLTIILYKNGATKPEIDFIRGVNSQFMLRNLLIRGLIEKIQNEDDKRITKYRATFETMRYLGVSDIAQLPNFEHFTQEIEKREQAEPVASPNVFNQ